MLYVILDNIPNLLYSAYIKSMRLNYNLRLNYDTIYSGTM